VQRPPTALLPPSVAPRKFGLSVKGQLLVAPHALELGWEMRFFVAHGYALDASRIDHEHAAYFAAFSPKVASG
jgi:hypothetical protein